jgi:uncharacterized membrane protein YgcG
VNEQQLADLFSEQIDRMLQGQANVEAPDIEDLHELLNLGKQVSQTQFQASSVAQAAFASQIAAWFGFVNGGTSMILGLSKVWFISIFIAVMVVTTGLGFIAVVATSIFVFSGQPVVAAPTSEPTDEATDEPTDEATGEPTDEATDEPTDEATDEPTDEATGEPTDEATAEPTDEPTAEPTAEPSATPVVLFPTIIFQSQLIVAQLCQGSYLTQQTLVNVSNSPIDDAALVWEVIEGADLVDQVNIVSPMLAQVPADDDADEAAVSTSTADSTTDDAASITNNFANFNQISAQQKIDLDIKVKVKDSWWHEPDGTEIKVKLSVKTKLEIELEHEEEDDDDDDGPGHGHGHHHGPSQVVTIVKQGVKWVTLTGFAHPYGNQTLLVNGHVIAINNCTGLPPQLPIGSNVEIIGIILPNGTFTAINITIININIFTGNFNSGVPSGGGDDNDDGGSGGGGGGGGSKGKGKGGSKKGGGGGGGGGGSGGSGGS